MERGRIVRKLGRRVACTPLLNKLIANAFDGANIVFADFFAEFADMHVDSAVANHDGISPNCVVNFVAGKHLFGF